MFITLKLTHVIDWSWFMVLLPEIIEVGVALVLLIIWGISALVITRD